MIHGVLFLKLLPSSKTFVFISFCSSTEDRLVHAFCAVSTSLWQCISSAEISIPYSELSEVRPFFKTTADQKTASRVSFADRNSMFLIIAL